MDSWLNSKKVRDMILIMPNSYNRFMGSWYTNSSTTGNWADYIAKDLIEYIDSHYRTLRQRESRAVIGHSMGGYGGMAIGMNYPDVFGCIGSISGVLDMNRWLSLLSGSCSKASKLKNLSDFNSQDVLGWWSIACCTAFCPNPDNPPFYCDFPWELDESNSIVKNKSAYDRFMSHDILTRLSTNVEVLLSMREIYIECGIRDEVGLISDLRSVHDELQRLGVSHYYHEFDGSHASHVMSNTGDALEVFSKSMTFEMLTRVEPKGKLATTWGEIRK
jgi:S-formylglutathione hydrolase FrmB